MDQRLYFETRNVEREIARALPVPHFWEHAEAGPVPPIAVQGAKPGPSTVRAFHSQLLAEHSAQNSRLVLTIVVSLDPGTEYGLSSAEHVGSMNQHARSISAVARFALHISEATVVSDMMRICRNAQALIRRRASGSLP